MLDIPNLTTKWGHIFGGVDEFDTFRGTTDFARADTISADYVTAAEQRLAAEGIYAQMESVNTNLQSTVNYFFTLAKQTLSLAAQEDTAYPISLDDDTLLQKLINDMVAQSKTFQRPTTQIGGSAVSADAATVTTLQGTPYGTGTIVGSIVEPRTGIIKYYSYAETIAFKCTVDSYTGGVIAGRETFAVQTFSSVNNLNSSWPKGSGVNTNLVSSPSKNSSLFGNAYFDNWDTSSANTPLSWVLSILVPGTTIFRDTDAYVGSYACKLTAALVNSELKQPLVGFTGNTNYMAAIRVKRPGTITGGVLTVALRDNSGAILTNALGANLSFTVSLTGAAGSYTLTKLVFSVPRGFATPNLSIKVTTAMVAGESVLLDTVELIPMSNLYVGGPDVAFLPGNVGWAKNDSYSLAVTNVGGGANPEIKETFVGCINRLYSVGARAIDLPTALSPTESDSKIV